MKPPADWPNSAAVNRPSLPHPGHAPTRRDPRRYLHLDRSPTPGEAPLAELLENGRVLGHPRVRGEIALGHLSQRQEILESLAGLPQAAVASADESWPSSTITSCTDLASATSTPNCSPPHDCPPARVCGPATGASPLRPHNLTAPRTRPPSRGRVASAAHPGGMPRRDRAALACLAADPDVGRSDLLQGAAGASADPARGR